LFRRGIPQRLEAAIAFRGQLRTSGTRALPQTCLRRGFFRKHATGACRAATLRRSTQLGSSSRSGTSRSSVTNLNPSSFEDGGELAGHGRRTRREGVAVGGNLDAYDFARDGARETGGSRRARERVFAALDHAQCFRGNARGHIPCARKDRRSGFIPHPQIRLPCQMPNFRLWSGGLPARGRETRCWRAGLLTAAKIALVVAVDSVGDGVEFGLAGNVRDGEQFIFAMETAHGIVADVAGFPSPAFPPLRRGFRAQPRRRVPLRGGFAPGWRNRQSRRTSGAERLMRGEGEKAESTPPE